MIVLSITRWYRENIFYCRMLQQEARRKIAIGTSFKVAPSFFDIRQAF